MLYFLTPQEGAFPGVSRLFDETIAVVGGEHIFLKDLHKITKGDTTIFGAWSPSYAIALRRVKGKKIIHWASPLLQTELAGVESEYLNTILNLLNKNIIHGLWVIDKNNYEVLKREGVFYTPAPFSVERLKEYRMKDKDKEGVNLFTIFHPRKNVLTQLAGATLAQEENAFMLFTNGMPSMYQQFANSIGLNFYDWGFLPQTDYFSWLASSRLLLQTTLSESFCYVAAESLGLGVPVLMSPVVAKNMGIDGGKNVVDDISSAEEIRSLISHVLSLDGESYRELCANCIKSIEVTAQKNNAVVKETFINL
jgi:hypothetical protein